MEEIYTTELVLARILAKQGRHETALNLEDQVRSRHLDALTTMLRAQRRR